MKSLTLLLSAVALLAALSGCASDDERDYSPSQVAAQHSDFDATPRLSNTRF